MKLLVAGATGQLGRSLARIAGQRGIEIAALGRSKLDLTDPESVKDTITQLMPEFVINAAAYTGVDAAEKNSDLAFAINRDGAARLAKTCAEDGIPIIHISTDYVFDGLKIPAYAETDQCRPLGVYGRSKLEGERAVIAANPHHIIVRTSWLYSPFEHNFVKTMLHLAQTHDKIDVVDDQFGNPTYVPHLAGGILQLAGHLYRTGHDDKPWGIYNMTGAGHATWCGFAREVLACSARLGGPTASVRPITTSEYPTPAKRPANSRLDCSKLSSIFGIALPDWRTGTAECVSELIKRDPR